LIGAIQLCLSAAQKRDSGNRALAWIKDGCPEADSRKANYDKRIGCYSQIWKVIEAVDAASAQAGTTESKAINVARRREEAYGVINSSDDEVFQNCLYDWYLQSNWSQRLLEITSPFVRTYLQRKSENEKDAADLLWRYYTHHHEYFEAAKVQLQLAKSFFEIDLASRMEYLSRAKANASARRPGFGSLVSGRQEPILTEIGDELDCAGVQLDILKRLENDPRLHSSNRENVLKSLNDRILALDSVSCPYIVVRR
jgi:nuclear pore complex protein Nup155